MDWTTNVAVHESAAPEFARGRLLEKLGAGELDGPLLYGGMRQASLWLALHEALSPARTDAAVAALYEAAFARAAETFSGNVAHVVSLACGSGGKDLDAIGALRSRGRAVLYTPADFSVEMVLMAQRAAAQRFRGLQGTPLVCELTRCTVLPAILKGFDPSGAERLILFLGTIHNYWPPEILRSLLYPLRAQDRLLLSANLAPAEGYRAAVGRIQAQYDNAPTRAWLWGALSELGLGPADGDLSFGAVPAEELPELLRLEAGFQFARARTVALFGAEVKFAAGARLRVFYSYRFTAAQIRKFLGQAGLAVAQEWIAPEEGLFLCARASQ